MISGGAPTPYFKQVYLFIDGKNLVELYNNIKSNYKDKDELKFIKNQFVWCPDRVVFPQLPFIRYEIVRAYYYTACKKDAIESLTREIKTTRIENENSSFFLTPSIITLNQSDNNKVKGDDIKICIDSIHHASNNNTDIIYLFTADKDFIPLIEELQRLGKQVFVASFKESLSDKLRDKADFVWELNNSYFVTQ